MRPALLLVLMLSAVLVAQTEAKWFRRIRIRVRRIIQAVSDAGVRCGCGFQWPDNHGRCSCSLGKRSLDKRSRGSYDTECTDTVDFDLGAAGKNFKAPGDAISEAIEKLVKGCEKKIKHRR